jgi:hypothetical protein
VVDRDLARLEKKIDSVIALLTGNDRPELGVIVRLDRLEQNEKRRNWWVRATAGAWITTACAFIGSKLGFKF